MERPETLATVIRSGSSDATMGASSSVGLDHGVRPTKTVPAAPAKPVGGLTALASPEGAYNDLTRLIERLHRRFLDVLRHLLHRHDIVDINAVQCLLLCNIGNEEISARHLMERGYYQGSNASYNIKKLVDTGYLDQRPAPHDRRSTLLKLSAKGRTMCELVASGEAQLAAPLAVNDLTMAAQTLRRLEHLWDDYVGERA